MIIAITGATGFLGTALIAHLTATPGVRVLALTSSTADAARARWSAAGAAVDWNSVQVIETSDRGVASALGATDGIDWLVNCAFPRNRGGAELAAGLEYQRSLFVAAERSGVHAVMNMSSQSVYRSDRTVPADESAELDLDTPYATAKYASELLAETALEGGRLVQGRLSSLIAPGFDQRVVNKLVRRAIDGHNLVITTPHIVFDYMDVRDAVRAIAAVMEVEPDHGVSTVNIGSGVPHSLGDIGRAVASVLTMELGLSTTVQVADSDEQRSSALDCTRLRELYGFEPQFELTDSIGDIARSMS